MNCIDAIEGNVKRIISRLHEVCLSERIEESEFVRWVKVVIDATDSFLIENKEITPDPDIVRNILVSHAKMLWMAPVRAARATDHPTDAAERFESTESDTEYLSYYFDYLYHHGNFPL